MNHRVNAKAHQLPPCPECLARRCEPCTSDGGFEREPHRSRQRIVDGEIFVIEATDARARRQLRAIRELAATMPRRRHG